MPELPEVETVIRELKPVLTNRRLEDFVVYWPRTFQNHNANSFSGAVIQCIKRKGKYIIWQTNKGWFIIHLRMTGQLLIHQEGEAEKELKHIRAEWRFNDHLRVLFNDSRKFGRIVWTDNAQRFLAKIGPDALDKINTPQWFYEQLVKRRQMIKGLLLSQKVISGLGNIYVDESLFRAGIHPASLTHRIPEEKIRSLHKHILEILKFAIAHMGSTISDYRDALGNVGQTQHFFQVYQQQGKLCVRCGSPIIKIRVSNRGTHVCENCQELYV